MSTVRKYGTVRYVVFSSTVRYGSFANKYLLDHTFSKIDLQISFTNFIYKFNLQIAFTNCIYKLHLQIAFTNCIYKLHLQISFTYKFHLQSSFTNLSQLYIAFLWVWYGMVRYGSTLYWVNKVRYGTVLTFSKYCSSLVLT
jgi:hypothetical protein